MLRISDGTWANDFTLRVVQQNDVTIMESGNVAINIDNTAKPGTLINSEVGPGNVYLTMEDGSHIVREDSTLDTSVIRNLVGQTITQAAVTDTTIEVGGIYASGGFSVIEEATAQVERKWKSKR